MATTMLRAYRQGVYACFPRAADALCAGGLRPPPTSDRATQ